MLQQLHYQMLQQLRVAVGSKCIRHAHKARTGQAESASSSSSSLPSIDFQSTLPLIAAQCLIKQSVFQKLALHLACLSSPSASVCFWPCGQFVAIRGQIPSQPASINASSRTASLPVIWLLLILPHTHTHTGHTYTVAHLHYATYCKLFAAAIAFAFANNQTTKLNLQQKAIAMARK